MTLKLYNRRKAITAIIRHNPVGTYLSFSIMFRLRFFLTALYLSDESNEKCRNYSKPALDLIRLKH
jgi:hypothetical protein